jgi:hypothetical protein
MEWRILWFGCVYIWLLSIKLDSGAVRKSGEAGQRGISWCDGGCYLEPTWFFWESAVFGEVVLKRCECVEIMKTDDE